jgi:hypothetical protein
VDQILDDLFDILDELLLKHEFGKVDSLLYAIMDCSDLTIRIGVLTITLAAKNKLEMRSEFFFLTANKYGKVVEGLE